VERRLKGRDGSAPKVGRAAQACSRSGGARARVFGAPRVLGGARASAHGERSESCPAPPNPPGVVCSPASAARTEGVAATPTPSEHPLRCAATWPAARAGSFPAPTSPSRTAASQSPRAGAKPRAAGGRPVNLLDGRLRNCAISCGRAGRWSVQVSPGARRGDPSGIPLESFRDQYIQPGAGAVACSAHVEAGLVEADRVEGSSVEGGRVEGGRVEGGCVDASRVDACRVETVRAGSLLWSNPLRRSSARQPARVCAIAAHCFAAFRVAAARRGAADCREACVIRDAPLRRASLAAKRPAAPEKCVPRGRRRDLARHASAG
jgi:hypothetical protein